MDFLIKEIEKKKKKNYVVMDTTAYLTDNNGILKLNKIKS